jgi:two-component system cell cycle response regulator
VPWFSPDMESLLAVGAAMLNEDGTVIEANAGFLRIVKLDRQGSSGAHVARFFLQPNFASLVRADARPDGEIYRGLLTMGDDTAVPQTLRARIWRHGSKLRLVAEYDIEELERLNEKMLDLNHEYANSQLGLAQTNLNLQQRQTQIVALALTDSLTGLGNRRHLDQALVTEISRAQRTGKTLCAFMLDIDHFKHVNDTFGHEIGDRVLTAFGELLGRQMRTTEVVARTGGEEFIALMPHTDLGHCIATAERIRTAIAALRIEPLIDGVTASFGVAQLAAGEEADAFMRRVDLALYQAKHSGRNRVVAG